MKKLSIITPVYCNALSLEKHIQEVNKLRDILIKDYNMTLEIFYVEDGSEDESLLELKKIKKNHSEWTKIISLTKNFGTMNAIAAGMKYVTGDCVSLVTADLQDPPLLLLPLVKAWQEGHDFSICVRRHRQDPLLTTLFSKLFNKLARLLVIKTYPLGGYDLHVLDKKFIPIMQQRAKNFNLQIYTYWIGIKPKVFYADREKRIHGKSKWTFRKKFKLFIDSFIGFSTAPIKIISGLALLTSLSSFLYALFIFIMALEGKIPIPGYATTICLMSFLFGLVILMLTIIAEYMVRIYDEVSNKPQYIIKEII